MCRQTKGLSQKQVADDTGISLRAYQYYETGEKDPSSKVLLALADYFGVGVEYLAGKTDENGPVGQAPRVFISYSWTSPEYVERVRRIATFLRERGVDVIYDQWDLKPGHDVNRFMEESITNSDFVLTLCDGDSYSKKANKREGGVGKETFMISEKVFSDAKQEKFIPVIMDKADNGFASVPEYMAGRFYIDLSFDENAGLDMLLRHIFGKPALQKPPIGTPPEFIMQDEAPFIIPSNAAALRALNEGKPTAAMLVETFLEESAESLEQYRVPDHDSSSMDEYSLRIVDSIDEMRGIRDSVLDVVVKFVRLQAADNENISIIHRFIERVYVYTDRPEGTTSYTRWSYDNFRFFVYEIFLYTLAACIKYEKFDALPEFLTGYVHQDRYLEYYHDAWDSFNWHLASLEYWTKTQDTRWLSPEGHLLKERSNRKDIQWIDLLQADTVLLISARGNFWAWTGPYLERHEILPLFARSTSLQYAMKYLPSLGFSSITDFKTFLKEKGVIHTSGALPIDYRRACNMEGIGQRP